MNKLQKRLRDSACVALALFEVFAFTGCGKKTETSDTISYEQYIAENYGTKKQNFNYPANFKDTQIWVTNVNGEFHNEDVKVTEETLFKDDGLKRLNVVDIHSNDVLASVLYYDYENYDSVLENLKEEYGKRNGQVIFTVNYYDVVKKLFGEKNEYTDSEIFAVNTYIDDYIDLRIENIK